MTKLFLSLLARTYGVYLNILSFFSSKKAAKIAFKLFATPRKGKVLPQQVDFLQKAKKEVVLAEGIHIQVYQWKGNKETILLMHGWESNAFRWRNLIGFLQKSDYNIIALDGPGHGYSTGKTFSVPMYTKVTQVLIEKYCPNHIIAHSLGGTAALYNNYLYTNASVNKMIILGAPSEFKKIVSNYKQLLRFNNRVLKALNSYIHNIFDFEIDEFSIAEFVKTNTKKGLLIHDEFDKIAHCSNSEMIHKNWGNSTFIKTQGLGHSLQYKVVNQQIIDFLNT